MKVHKTYMGRESMVAAALSEFGTFFFVVDFTVSFVGIFCCSFYLEADMLFCLSR